MSSAERLHEHVSNTLPFCTQKWSHCQPFFQAYSSTEDSLRLLRLKTTSSGSSSNKDKSSSPNNNNYPDIHLKKDEFLMPLAKWMTAFTHLEVVHLDSDTARDEPSLQDKIPWLLRIFHGHWRKGVTAGGCRNYPGAYNCTGSSLTLESGIKSSNPAIVTLASSLLTDLNTVCSSRPSIFVISELDCLTGFIFFCFPPNRNLSPEPTANLSDWRPKRCRPFRHAEQLHRAPSHRVYRILPQE